MCSRLDSNPPSLTLRRVKLRNVIPAGFEPATYCLEGSCSIQLSYETLMPEADRVRHSRAFAKRQKRCGAEKGGFEPPVQNNPYDSLANYWFKPLTHLSVGP